MDQTLDEAIYNRYIAPTKRQRTGRVGLEFELPVVNREHAPVDFEVIHKVTDAFLCKFHFQEAGRDDNGFIYAALDGKTGDSLSFDCSYNTLEFSFGTEMDLHTVCCTIIFLLMGDMDRRCYSITIPISACFPARARFNWM